MGIDDAGRFRGHIKSLGLRPRFLEKLADSGIQLDAEIFEPEPFLRDTLR
jgi:pilus assembly protein CpaF